MNTEMYHCVEVFSGKSGLTRYTRWQANIICHKLNQWNPDERWIVEPCGVRYIPNHGEQRRPKC